jgi:hypothetical protein
MGVTLVLREDQVTHKTQNSHDAPISDAYKRVRSAIHSSLRVTHPDKRYKTAHEKLETLKPTSFFHALEQTNPGHAFVEAACYAHYHDYKLVLSPDMFFQLFMSSVCAHVASDPEKYRGSSTIRRERRSW